MIRVGVGHSQIISASQAIKQATTMAMGNAKLAKADLAIVFATTDYQDEYTQLFEGVQEISGCDHLTGCSGISLLTSEGEFEERPAVAVLVLRSDQISAFPFLAAANEEAAIGTTIRGRIEPELRDTSLLVVFPDVRSVRPAELVQQIGADGHKLPIVGGAASGDPTSERIYQWCGEKVVEGGVAGVLLTGLFHTEIGVAQGCQPIGRPLEITRAAENVIYELDGQPALQTLQKLLELLTEEDISKSGRMIFLGIATAPSNRSPKRGDYLIRSLIGIDRENSAIGIADAVEVGQIVQFHLRNPFAARADIIEIMNRLHEKTREQPPAFGLYFNCMGRGKGLYGEENHDIQVIKEKFPDLPIIGFFGNAEFAPVGNRNFAHTYTGVLVLCSAA